MCKNIRIIPRLDIKGENLVKGIHLEGLRVLGKPEDFAYEYCAGGADELLYIDIVASLYGRNNLIDIVRRTAANIFIPLTVGGGIRSVDDIRMMLRAGADKVAINTAVVKRPEFISEAANAFGSQCIVLSIEAKRTGDGTYEAYTDNGRERTGLDIFKWALRGAELGAGEILITSIDNEGTGKGFDIDLIRKMSAIVDIPVISCGGAGKMGDFEDAVVSGSADAISAASVFHYHLVKTQSVPQKFNLKSNLDHLAKSLSSDGASFGAIETFSVKGLKSYLVGKGLPIRPVMSAHILIEPNAENIL